MLTPSATDPMVKLIETLFLLHANMLRGFIHGLVPHRDAVEDILHDTFVTVRSKAGEFTPSSNFGAWARTIARIKTLEHLRRSRRWPMAMTETTLELLCESADSLDEWEEQMAALRDCVEQLPLRARELVRRRCADPQPTVADLAEQLGLSVGTREPASSWSPARFRFGAVGPLTAVSWTCNPANVSRSITRPY